MLGLSGVVAIAASASATFVVVSVVGIVVWVRFRKERHALRLLGLKQGQYAQSINTFTGNTLTELSHEEGTVLGTHGQLPYGRPGEWGQLISRESLVPKNNSDSSFPLIEKCRSPRRSISRSRSRRLSRFSKHSRLSSMATVDETVIHRPISPPRISKEDVPLSAVEGVLELPAERTPRHTPEMHQDDAGFQLGMRPVSPGWPFPGHKERSGLFPVVEDRNSQEMFDPPPRIFEESPQRIRGNSICSQSPGIAPSDPVPPPPAAFPTDRMSYARNDSVMRLSSMSLDTTNSSILDDGRNGPGSADTELTSPIFPAGGTFVPYSANDVGKKDGRRSFIAANTNTAMPPLQSFPVRSSSTAEGRRKSSMDWMAPRRSMTTASRNPSDSSHRLSGPPCRSDSLSSNPPTRNASFRSGTPVSLKGFQLLNSVNWRSSGSQNPHAPHFSQFQQPTVYEDEDQNDPFYGGSPQSTGTLFSVGSPGQTTSSSMPPSPMQRSSLSQRSPLVSALKSAKSQRKGHRRQNCVRISIHPPMTFAGPTFSPTVEEEPEDIDQMEEVDLRESTINGKALPVPPVNTTSPLPLSTRSSRRNKAQPSSLGPLAEEPQSHINRTPSKKRNQAPSATSNRDPQLNKHHNLPELVTSLPPATDGALSHTPSPSRIPPVWELPAAPPPSYENSPGTGSPRRSAVKGPRSQPPQTPRAARSNSTQSPPKSSMDPFTGPSLTSGLPLVTGTQGSDWRKSTDSLHRSATDAADSLLRRNRDSQGSLASGLGPLPSSPIYGVKTSKGNSTVRDRVTIWEDANRGGSPPKPPAAQLAGAYVFPNNVSPDHAKNSTPRSLCTNSSPARLNGQRVPPTPVSARRGMATPTGKGLGLGIGAATPVSLYDGDGFLRE